MSWLENIGWMTPSSNVFIHDGELPFDAFHVSFLLSIFLSLNLSFLLSIFTYLSLSFFLSIFLSLNLSFSVFLWSCLFYSSVLWHFFSLCIVFISCICFIFIIVPHCFKIHTVSLLLIRYCNSCFNYYW